MRSETTTADDSATAATTASPVTVRPLHGLAEFAACVDLQRETWGAGYQDIVPASLLKVTQRVGGVVAGAFDADDRLVGFVYGLTGPAQDGRMVHWSHMLALRGPYRNHGIGRRLKEYQRRLLRESGVEAIEWTFDPLVARNAHLNLNRLGVRVVEYVPDMYGDTGSDLHSFGTDRFIVTWPIVGGGPRAEGHLTADEVRSAPVVNAAPGRPAAARVAADARLLRIEIPHDVESMRGPELALARAWRASTREAFVCHLGRYHVDGFERDVGGRCFYVLRLGDSDGG